MTPSNCARTARSPWKRKKNCLFIAIPIAAVIAFIQMIEMNEVYSPMRPLSDARSEARRLLKIMTHYNYQCNTTASLGNSSQWPICLDRNIGLNLDSKEKKIVYTIGLVLLFLFVCIGSLIQTGSPVQPRFLVQSGSPVL